MIRSIFFSFMASAFLAISQSPLDANALNNEMFSVSKGDDVVFAADPDSFVSIGLQEYLAHPYRVLELSMTFEGDGNRLRIYALENIEVDEFGKTPSHRAQAVQDRATAAGRQSAEREISLPVPEQVVKNYPHTTHAGTVEFLLPSFDQVRKTHEDLIQEFKNNDTVREALIEADIDLSF
ncbi:MAG: hypothetical protein LAT55_04750 [Opitutales bacterium]|nr:hypothetical protein [Opitutales bacterium]